jgi:RND family efflux transporter MFP subunit
MKHKLAWVAALLAVAVLASGAWRAQSTRQARQHTLQEQAQRSPAPLTLQKSELLALVPRHLQLDLPISGVLKARQQAFVKARAAGELQGLQVREGDSVRAGQVLAQIDATENAARLRQAEQQAQAAAAQLAIAQRQLENNRALVGQGFISPTALQTTQANWDAAQANHLAAQAGVELARKALHDTVLRSPIDGQVAQRLANNGERLGVEARVLEIVDPRELELEALLAPADALQVRLGQSAQLRLQGQDSGPSVRATVVRINPSAQASSRALPVYLLLERAATTDAATAALRQGQYVQGVLTVGSAQVLALPLEVVRTDKPEPYVQALENQRVVHRSVQLGARSMLNGQTWVAITHGLSEGAQVLAASVGLLREGTEVRTATTDAPAPTPTTEPAASAAPVR